MRITGENKALKAEKEQMPMMMDKFEHQDQMIHELKDKIKEIENRYQETKTINERF